MPAVQATAWCLTFNLTNYEGAAVDPVEPVLPEHADERYACWQLECGEEGNIHVQAYVELHRRVTAANLVACYTGYGWPHPHVEKRNGTAEQARDYAMKDDATRIEGPWERGDFGRGGQGKRNDLADAVQALKQGGLKRVATEHPCAYVKFHRGLRALEEELREEPTDADFQPRNWQRRLLAQLEQPANDRTIIWVFDQTGNRGKSRLARHLLLERNAVQLEGRVQDMAYVYNREPIVIFDITRAQADHSDHLYTFAEKLKNGFILSTKYEPVPKKFAAPHVVFFANSMPDASKWSADRLFLMDLSLDRWHSPNFLPALVGEDAQPAPAEPAAPLAPAAGADPFDLGLA